MAEVTLQNLSFRYPGNPADTLCELNLKIPAGEAHALLGGSGSGKTTLLNLLSGLLPVESGRILIGGRDVGGLSPRERRVTQVFQFPVLYEAMTLEENFAFTARDLPASERLARIRDIAERLGISDLLAVKPQRLTLVQKQLAAIGKALVRPDVSLVLLDEPLTAAEPEHKWQLRQTLKVLQAELAATMIYVTHDQTEALTFADRVSLLHEGRILQTGSAEALLDEPTHEYVGHFVGSPGMNLVAGEIRAGRRELQGVDLGASAVAEGDCRFGFRPEWARVRAQAAGLAAPAAGVPVKITTTRTLATRRSVPEGLVMAELNGQEVVTRQPLDAVTAGDGWLELNTDRLVTFRDGWRVDAE